MVIQNIEKSVQHKMVFLFFKEHNMSNDIKNFSVNGKDGIIKIEFTEPEKAKAFYENSNFKDKMLVRPFNIYYSLKLNDCEMKKYLIEGVTEEKQRDIFDAAKKLGACKLYTNYS